MNTITRVASIARPTSLRPFAPPVPLDNYAGAAEKASPLLIKLMNIPVPTASRHLSDAQKAEVKALLQPGDVLLETSNAYPGWQIAERLAFKANYTHAAMYMGNGKIIDSGTKEVVAESDVDELLDSYHIAVLRPKYQTAADKQAALDYCTSVVGRPYDDYFDQSNDKALYCAELVYNALQAMPNKIDAPMSHPLGHDIVGPDAFARSSQIDMVWNSGSSFWKNMATHWPVPLATVGAAMWGHRIAGVPGAVIGGIVGTAAFIAVGDFVDPNIRHAKGKGL